MDKNNITGIILIGIILIAYSIWTAPDKEQIEKSRKTRDSLEYVEHKKLIETQKLEEAKQKNNFTNSDENSNNITDSIKNKILKEKYGTFASSVKGVEEFITLENDLLKIKISNLGGRIESVEVKNYKTYDSLPLILFQGDSTIFGLEFFAQNRDIFTNDLFFKSNTNKKNIVVSGENKTVSMRLNANKNSYIEYIYTLASNSYNLKFDVKLVNMNEVIPQNVNYLNLNWDIYSPCQEKGKKWENDHTTIYFKHYQDEVDYLSETSEHEEAKVSTKIKWVAFKQQFFSSVLIADNAFASASMQHNKLETSQEHTKYFQTQLNLPYLPKQNTQTIPMKFYFGPNHFNTLEAQEVGLEALVPLGWGIFGLVNEFFIIPVFNFLETLISNYGLIILVLTIFIKMILFPFTYKSYLSTAKMRVLKPEIDKINSKISKDKAMERQQATMGLYRKAGVNPMGGCLPMLLQMPILFAMFRFFPSSIELRQESFLWADDLSSYDSIFQLPFSIPFYGDHVSLFTILMAISLALTTKMNSGQMNDSNSQMPGMKTMMYMMPIMMLFFFNGYAAGLSYYYFLSNLVTFLQMLIIKRYVDEDKIFKQLEANKKKPVKKSKFQQRLEDMAKQKGIQKPNQKNKK